MTIAGIGGLPTVADTALPAHVRNGTAEAKDAYRTALAFEQVLVQQLTEQLAATTGEDEESASAATSTYRDMLPAALAEGITASGGLGLADQLYRTALGPTASSTSPAAPSVPNSPETV
ncbi:MAG: rod-binding protein [Solirubrobacteraceae bacterium]|nr:rod-binding protein [Solirubrobacteraceae bacterium]